MLPFTPGSCADKNDLGSVLHRGSERSECTAIDVSNSQQCPNLGLREALAVAIVKKRKELQQTGVDSERKARYWKTKALAARSGLARCSKALRNASRNFHESHQSEQLPSASVASNGGGPTFELINVLLLEAQKSFVEDDNNREIFNDDGLRDMGDGRIEHLCDLSTEQRANDLLCRRALRLQAFVETIRVSPGKFKA